VAFHTSPNIVSGATVALGKIKISKILQYPKEKKGGLPSQRERKCLTGTFGGKNSIIYPPLRQMGSPPKNLTKKTKDRYEGTPEANEMTEPE